ncbi:hypothetical protein M5J14_08290 [Lysinibacillus sp. OL1_EC]|uniref:hypothetical protein n=1 Tax=unclassified Lysinibacillus TaxID=2636778 RepID=UPI001038EAB1|nr:MULTISPECIES: hypothetical protein [unclassified Lysinibacillus]MCM0624525.1 hypothetical protein [Lysinibacillus sp. OL1_EC]TBV87868.1 hypothetical protein EW028_09205 [Lysinibacillus sp. OL1]
MNTIENQDLPVAGQLKQVITEVVYQNQLLGRKPIATDALYQKVKEFLNLSDEQMDQQYPYGGGKVADKIRAAYHQLKIDGVMNGSKHGVLEFTDSAFKKYDELKKLANKNN